MKLNKLASAVSISLVALALTACGGSDDSSPVAPTQPTNPTQPTEPTQPANPGTEGTTAPATPADAATLVEPVSPLIGSFDATKGSSVHAAHYLRKTDSNFDYGLNPEKTNTGSEGIVSVLTLNEQNPYLSNFVIGKEFGKLADGTIKQYGYDYLGEYVDPTRTKAELADTVQGSFVVVDTNDAERTVTVPVLADRLTIQEANRDNVTVGDTATTFTTGAGATLVTNSGARTAADVDGKSGLVGYSASTTNMGSVRAGSLKLTYGQEENLVNATTNLNNTKSTRVFGKNYKDYESDATVANTYPNSYIALTNGNTFKEGKSITLKDVQYGRLTANIDSLLNDPTTNEDDLVYRKFENAGTPGTSDIYFYRGTNETSLEQMKALGTTGKLEYRGHALTYGIDPLSSTENSASNLPNSFGASADINTFGNFVHASYDLSTQHVEGAVYNFINKKDSAYTYNALIDFAGDVKGNTIVNGAAKNNKGEIGTLIGAFYGDKAQELGGSISSVTNDYGVAKWGAVFGAQLQTEAPQIKRGAINVITGAAGNSTVKAQNP